MWSGRALLCCQTKIPLKFLVGLALLALFDPTCAQQPLTNETEELPLLCPGRYCGRDPSGFALLGNEAPCGPCPRAYRTDGALCQPCTSDVGTYDALFLAFMTGLVVLPTVVVSTSLVPLIEGVLALTLTLPAMTDGTMRLNSCGLDRLSDWYPALFNPRPERTSTLHCVNEVTYPLVTFVLIFDSFSLLLVLLIRAPLKYRQVLKGDASIYLTLCLLPAHALIHVVFGGLLYYVFPYLVTLGMIILQTARMSKELRRNPMYRNATFRAAATQFSMFMFGSPIKIFGYSVWHCLLAFGVGALAIAFDHNRAEYWAAYFAGPFVIPLVFIATHPFTEPDFVLD